MIKKLIFDIDNTLIEWKKEYETIVLEKTYLDFKINASIDLINQTDLAFIQYEESHEYYSKTLLINDINKLTNQNLPIEFLDYYFKNSIIFATPDSLPKEYINTLEFLSSKYELVALTNWFASPQIQRLKKVGIFKFFSTVFSTENVKLKPHKESFLSAIGSNTIDECCMIGDSFNNDICGALALNLSCVYLTDKSVNLPNCVCIKDFSDLKKIFDV